jgi:hypothetical protein
VLLDGEDRCATFTHVVGPTGKVKTGAVVYPLLPGDRGYERAVQIAARQQTEGGAR